MKYSHWVLWRAGSFLFHITVTSIFIYSFIYQELTREERYSRSSKSPNPEPEFGGDWKFLTRWDFFIQTVVMTSCMVIDIIMLGRIFMENRVALISTETISEKRHPIQRFIELIDSAIFTLAFPLGLFVTITFWGLWAIDPGNVTSGPNNYPITNHIVHTGVGIAIFIEIILTYHKRPQTENALMVLIVFIVTFICWTFFVHYKTGFWLYPIFGKLSPVFRGLFFFGAMLLCISLYFLGNFIHRRVWPEERIAKFINGPILDSSNEMDVDLVDYRERIRQTTSPS